MELFVDSLKRLSMTMEDFEQLDEIEQMSAIMQFGHLMAENSGSDKRIFFYRFENFYVAASYESNDQLCDINCFPEIHHRVPQHRKTLQTINPAERV